MTGGGVEAWFSLAYLLANTIPNLAPLLLYFYSKRLDMTNKKTMTKMKTMTKTALYFENHCNKQNQEKQHIR